MKRKLKSQIAAALKAKKLELAQQNNAEPEKENLSIKQQKKNIAKQIREEGLDVSLPKKKTSWLFEPNMLVRSKKVRGNSPLGENRIFLVVDVFEDIGYLDVLVDQTIQRHRAAYFFPIN